MLYFVFPTFYTRHLKSAIASVGKNGLVIHIAHSQGALVTHLATKQLSLLEMNQIEVLAFGGAAALRRTSKTPFHRCVNYYALNDPLLFVVPSAEQALRSGCVVDEEFCFLAPRSGDPIEDHGLLGPTYSQALNWEGQRFQNLYQNLPFRTTRYVILLFLNLVQILWRKIDTIVKETIIKFLPILLLVRGWLECYCLQPIKTVLIKCLPILILLRGWLEKYCLQHFKAVLIKWLAPLLLFVWKLLDSYCLRLIKSFYQKPSRQEEEVPIPLQK